MQAGKSRVSTGGTRAMNCANCGIKISPSVARQQEGGENLCRDCYGWKRAREQQRLLQEEEERRRWKLI